MMDCANARLLLNFLRNDEMDPAERSALLAHLEACPDCSAQAQSESQFDEALGRALRRMPVPAGLKGRLLAAVAARRPRHWPWAAAAAALLLAASLGAYVWWSQSTVVDFNDVIEIVDYRTKTNPDNVESEFASLGYPMRFPRMLNPNLLESYDVVEFH